MLNEVELNVGVGGAKITVDTIAGNSTEVVKAAFGVEGDLQLVAGNNPMPVTLGLTDTQLRATPVPISGTVSTGLTQPLTDTQLRATPVPISGTVTVTGTGDASAANQTLQITQETAINTVLGLVADAIVAAGATGSVSAKLRRATQGLEDLKTLIVLAAGVNIIGKVGIDQTTPGTTNGVQVNAALPAGTNAIGKLAANSGVIIGAVEIAAAQTLAAVTAITNNVNTVEVPPTTIFNGKTTTTTAGTRVTLAASQVVKSVTIKALSTNAGFIYVGNTSVAASNGFQLSAGDTLSFDIANLNTINLDSSVNGEGVSYLGIN